MTLSEIISGNLVKWMADHPRLNTIDRVAEASGVGFGTVQRVKNGTGNPTAQNLQEIAQAFGRSAIDLMTPDSAAKVQEASATYCAKDHPQNELEAELLRLARDWPHGAEAVVTLLRGPGARRKAPRNSTIKLNLSSTPEDQSKTA